MATEISLGSRVFPWIRPLVEGTVEPTGVDLTVADGYISPEYYEGMLNGEFDMAEFSLGLHLASQEKADDYSLSAIPVYPIRRFRHSFVYTREGSDVDEPSDLNGATVGLINWQFTGGLWARGTLAERYDLDLTSVEWKKSRPEYTPTEIPDRYSVSMIDGGDTDGPRTFDLLEQRLADGALDAVITPTEFRHDSVERLFADPFETERAYYEDTGIFPIHHVVAIRDEVIDEHPRLPDRMYEAFEEALDAWWEEFTSPGWFKRSPLVWSLRSLEEQLEVFDGNPWEYGLTDRNRRNLSRVVQYATDQGVIDREYDVESLFVDGVGT